MSDEITADSGNTTDPIEYENDQVDGDELTFDVIEAINQQYDWPAEEVLNIESVYTDIVNADTIEDWSYILGDHIQWGNNKLAEHVAIFNMNSASDCRNLGTERCQVDANECYAYQSEEAFPFSLPYRRRQELIWDHMNAKLFADAFYLHAERKQLECSALRLSQSGDFRHRGDIVKAERVTRLLADNGIPTYTYSASSDLNWDGVEELTVNQSNQRDAYGDRLFTAIGVDQDPDDVEGMDDSAVHCPYQATDGEIKCGDCRLCINQDGPDVYVNIH